MIRCRGRMVNGLTVGNSVTLPGIPNRLRIDENLYDKWDQYLAALRKNGSGTIRCCFVGETVSDHSALILVWHEGRPMFGRPDQDINTVPDGAEIYNYESADPEDPSREITDRAWRLRMEDFLSSWDGTIKPFQIGPLKESAKLPSRKKDKPKTVKRQHGQLAASVK